MTRRAAVEFGREICGDLDAAEAREWLVTNGVGGFASGTIAGSATRRYHGLLIAALQPPLGRTQLVAALDETVRYSGADYDLATHRWASGTIDPTGFRYIDNFRLEGSMPVWAYALADALIEKRVWMRQGENTTFLQYTLLRGNGPAEMCLKALVNYRDYHSSTHAGDWLMNIEPTQDGVKILAFEGAAPFYLKSSGAQCEPRHDWYHGFFYSRERERGLDDDEDHLFAALFRAKLDLGASITFTLTTEASASIDASRARTEREGHEARLLRSWWSRDAGSSDLAPEWLSQLVLTADEFIVRRSFPDQPDGKTIIAGYHWFGDWGRDTMIALPGLTLVTGRAEIARQILLAFAELVSGGLLPNNFPDAGGKPEYGTVDAALWFAEAARHYFSATQDTVTLQRLFPALTEIIGAYLKGARYNTHVDVGDGLLYAGEAGVQLTWMDAKIGDWIITPRIGKPVEINALWINALESLAEFARVLRAPKQEYEKLAAQARESFKKFWNSERNCCYDVIDSPGIGNDASLRPNQIFAVSLPVSPLTASQQKSVVDICAQQLLTCFGLRSLAPGELGYRGRYVGGPAERDAAYHQGTVWGWLLGPFALAHFRVYRDRAAALRFLEPLGRQIYTYGLGSLGEIFDGNPPFTPRGCISQAWTVAETLRAWHALQTA